MQASRSNHSWLKRRPVKRDYSRKSFANPLFNPGRGAVRLRRALTVSAAVIALGGWIWFTAFSPAFRITEVKIEGNKNVADADIRRAVEAVLDKRRWFLLPQRSLLIVPESAIVADLNERFFFEELTVTKHPPHELVISLKERENAVLIAMPGGDQGLIGLDGMVTRLYPATQALDVVPKFGPLRADEQAPKIPHDYTVIYDDREEKLDLREVAVRPEIVKAAIALPSAFSATFGDAPVLTQIRLPYGAESQSLRAVTAEGWAIYLNADDGLQAQLDAAQTILKTKVGPDRRNLDYIDVRFGDKIFFKMKS